MKLIALCFLIVAACVANAAGAAEGDLSAGAWYGKIVSVNARTRSIVFAPACGPSGVVPLAGRVPVVMRIVKNADVEIYYRPGGSVEAGHVQFADLALLKSIAEHGRLPDFPPGWFVSVKDGAAVSIDEDSGIRRSAAGCISSASTFAFVNSKVESGIRSGFGKG